jgi:hypothetical protein
MVEVKDIQKMFDKYLENDYSEIDSMIQKYKNIHNFTADCTSEATRYLEYTSLYDILVELFKERS